MKVRVKTSNPVIYNRKPFANNNYLYGFQKDGFVNFDSSNSDLTTQFQEWYNVNRKGNDPAALSVDGIYGPLTGEAYATVTGQGFDATLGTAKAPTLSAPASTATAGKQGDTKSPVAVTDKKADATKAGATGGGMSTTTKIAIGAAGGIALLILIVLANKNNHAHVKNIANNIIK